jgi:hypothetical protein
MKNGLLLFLAIATLSGCTTRIGAFTFASTKNLGVAYAPLQTRVEGEDCVTIILFIPLGTLNPNIQDAVDRAVEKVPNGDMMTNVTLNEDLLFTLIYNRVCVRVTGDVVNTLASGTIQRAPAAAGTSLVPSARNPNLAPPTVNPNAQTNKPVPFEGW